MRDEVITEFDRQIQKALAIDPSPDFQARVRVRLAEEPPPNRVPTVWIACGAMALAIVLALSTFVPDRPEVRPRAADVMLPAAVGTVVASDAPALPDAQPAVVESAPPATRRSPTAPVVLVPTAEREGFRRFLQAVAENRVTIPAPATSPNDAPLSVPEITIEPVVIQPIDPAGE